MSHLSSLASHQKPGHMNKRRYKVSSEKLEKRGTDLATPGFLVSLLSTITGGEMDTTNSEMGINPIALRKAKIVCNFGLFECNRVNWL